ncbi:MAG: NACHT domain-containing protein, partial [Polyangiaceae bacterium]
MTPERSRAHRAPPLVLVAHVQKDDPSWERLRTHLAPAHQQGQFRLWHPGGTTVGGDAADELRSQLEQAHVIVLLVTADLLAEEAFAPIVRRAVQRSREGRTALLPVLVSKVDLHEGVPLHGTQMLPRSEKPILESAEHEREAIWATIAEEVRGAVGRAHRQPFSADRRDAAFGVDFHRSDLLFQVRRVAELLHPNATFTELDAPDPFEGAFVATEQKELDEAGSEPIGVLNTPIFSEEMLEGILSVFRHEIERPYRERDELAESRIVHPGDPAPEAFRKKARRRGVRLVPFSEYQRQVASFGHYLSWQAGGIDADSRYRADWYVPQRAEVRIRLFREKVESALDEMLALLTDPHPRFLLVLGDPGAGKTFLLRRLARLLGEAHIEGRAPAPVLIEMRNLEKSHDLDKLLAQHFASPHTGSIRVEAFRYMLSEGKAALLFDGFDELAFRVTYDRVLKHFQTVLQAAQGRAKVVVTSRTAHFMNDRQIEQELARKASGVEGYRMIKVLPFEKAQIRTALEKRMGDSAKADHRLSLLRAVEDLMGLSANPRMLDFVQGLPDTELVAAGAHDVASER